MSSSAEAGVREFLYGKAAYDDRDRTFRLFAGRSPQADYLKFPGKAAASEAVVSGTDAVRLADRRPVGKFLRRETIETTALQWINE